MKIGHLRQVVTISGLGAMLFKEAVKGVQIVDDNFRRYVGSMQIDNTTIVTTFRGFNAIDISNRYFTSKALARHKTGHPIGQHIDPRGILNKVAENGYVHTTENMVEYQHRKANAEGTVVQPT